LQENLLALLHDDDLRKSLNVANLNDLGSRRNSSLQRQASHQAEAINRLSFESNEAGLKSPAPSPVSRMHRNLQRGETSLSEGNQSTQKRMDKVSSPLVDGRAKRKRADKASNKSRRRQGRLVGLRG